jgi:predicted DsbA family dithiol-disulfide isomerase
MNNAQVKFMLSVIFITLTLVFSMVLTSSSIEAANMEWKVFRTFDFKDAPMDMALTPDGGQLFVLTDKGDILVYSQKTEPIYKINVGEGFDQMRMGPKGNILILSSKTEKNIKLLLLDFIQEIHTEGSPFKGPEGAPVVVVLFTDFQCPYCAQIAPVMDQVLGKYPKDVKIVFKNYPLRGHNFAMKAAEAALAAGKKGKFWECHDLLFQHYNELNDDRLGKIVAELGLDQAEFKKLMKDPSIQERIQQDMLDANQAGIKGTPSVFINGRAERNLTLQGLDQAVSEELEKIAKSSVKPTP